MISTQVLFMCRAYRQFALQITKRKGYHADIRALSALTKLTSLRLEKDLCVDNLGLGALGYKSSPSSRSLACPESWLLECPLRHTKDGF